MGTATPAQPGESSVGGLDLLLALPLVWALECMSGIALIAIYGLELPKIPPFAILASTLLSAGWTLLVSWFFVCRRHRKTIVKGFALLPVRRRTTAFCALGGIALAAAAAILMKYFSTGESFMAQLATPGGGFAVVIAIALLLPPVEELYYRGFIFVVLRKYAGSGLSVAVVSVWFTLVHVFQLAGDWIAIPVILVLAIATTLVRSRSASLLPSIVLHWTYNLALIVISLGTS